MKKNDDEQLSAGKLIIENSKLNVKLKQLKEKEENKVKLSDKTIKVTSVIKTSVIIIVVIGAFIGGWYSNTAYNNARQHDITTQAKDLVKSLK